MSYIPVFADVNPDIKLSEFIDWFYTSYMESMVHSRFPALNMPIVTYLQCVIHGFNFNIPWFYLSQMDFASVAKESKYEFSTTPVSNADNNIYLSLFSMKDSISIGFEYQTKLEKRFDMERVLRSVDVILELAPEYMERPIMELKDRVISSI